MHAPTLIEESLALYREIGDCIGMANELVERGRMARLQGDFVVHRHFLWSIDNAFGGVMTLGWHGLARFTQLDLSVTFGPGVLVPVVVELVGMPLLYFWRGACCASARRRPLPSQRCRSNHAGEG
jgi:hypothetical protein